MIRSTIFVFAMLVLLACSGPATQSQKAGQAPKPGELLTGQSAMGDWTTDAPGVRRRITVADLPKPYATESARNSPRLVPRPAGALPQVPTGFKVEEFQSG